MKVQLLGLMVANALTISQAMAQQPANQPPAGNAPLIRGAAGAAIGAEGERKPTILTFQDDKLAAEYLYFLWRGGCYVRFPSGDYQSVPLTSCSPRLW